MLIHANHTNHRPLSVPVVNRVRPSQLLITLIIRCVDNTYGTTRKPAFYRGGDIVIFLSL